MAARQQIICTYDDHPRELCPIVLGHSGGQEKALTYQFAGRSKSGLPPQANGAASFCPGSAALSFARGLGMPAIAIPSRKAASKSSTSISTRQVLTSQNAGSG